MSVYNGLPFLEQAIESIANQTFSDFEFVIIDDGSVDGSTEVLDEWWDRDSRIRLILHEENRGLGCALEEGVEAARAPWIARMDSDDIAAPDRLERQRNFLKAHPEVDILGTWAVDVDEEGQVLGKREYPTDHEDLVRLIWTNPIVHPTVMMRASAIRKAGSYSSDVRKRQDYELWFRCVAAGLTFANLPEYLLQYRFTADYYKKNDLSVAWNQAMIGWKGCRLVKSSPVAYVGVFTPVVRCLLPARLNNMMHRVLHHIDPRRAMNGKASTDSPPSNGPEPEQYLVK